MTFQEWIALQDTEKIYLVTLTLAKEVGGSVVTEILYLSTHAKVFDEIFYEPVIKGVPRFSRKIQEIIEGASMPSWGDLEIINSEGQFDDYVMDYAWDGRPIEIKVGGDPLDYEDYQTVLSGVMGTPRFDDGSVQVPVFDNQKRLEKKIPADLFDSSTYPNMDSNDLRKPVPIVYGTVKNIRAYCTNASTKLPYKVAGHALYDITAVYDDGISVSFTKDLANGAFTLSSAPSGTVTCDVKGRKDGSSLIELMGNCIKDLLINYGGFSSGEIDSTAITAFNTDCPYEIGYYLDSQKEILTILDEIITGANAFYGFTRAGKFQVNQFKAPAGDPDIIFADDIEAMDFAADPMEDIYWRVVLGYLKNWNDGEFERVTASDSAIKDLNLSAKERGEVETYLINQADAQAAADHFLDLWGMRRSVIRVTAKLQPLANELGQVVSLSRPRYGLAADLLRIVGIEEDYTSNRVKLELWG